MAGKIVSWAEIEREAIARIGQAEFDRRTEVARKVARKIADDPTWFAQDEDREGVYTFMATRLRSLAVQLTDFSKFESKDHDTLGCAVCKMMEKGEMI